MGTSLTGEAAPLLLRSTTMKSVIASTLVPHPRCLDWIISASRMLSAIFEWTTGEGLISSRFSPTAAMSDATIRRAALGFLSSSLLLGFPRSQQLLLGPGCPLNTSAGLYLYAAQQHEQVYDDGVLGRGVSSIRF